MRCGKQEHQLEQRCPAKNAKGKNCHKIGHFHKVCQSKKRAKQRANLVQTPQDDNDTHIDENGVRQPNPPRVNMLKHIEANKGGKHLKFSIASYPKGPYKHHIVVRVDTVHVNVLPVQNTSWSGPPASSAHVHKLLQQVLKPRDLLALRKVHHLHNGMICVNRLPLTKQDILSHYSSYFEGIGHFPGDPYEFHLKPQH